MSVKFNFLIFPHVHLLDLAGADQAILESIGYGADFIIEYSTLGPNVVSSTGLPIGSMKKYSEIELKENDFLIIPGSESSFFLSDNFKKQKELFSWIDDQYSKGVKVCSICSGAFALAQAGLLFGIPCTTHFKKTKLLQQLFPTAKVNENVLFTEYNGIYTSAGIASGIDMMLHIIEQLKGSYFAHLVARELVVYNRRSGNQKQQSDLLQFRNHIHAGVHNVQDWLHENLHKHANLEDLSETANMSSRNFTRVFKRETGVTVNDYITVLRKEKIRELMKNPNISRSQIARKCGLKSARQISRIIKDT